MGEMTVQTSKPLKIDLASDLKLVESFLQDCELRRLSAGTVEGYKCSLMIVSKLLRGRGLSITKLDREALSEVLTHLIDQGYVYNTLVQYFSALSGFSDYLVWEGFAQSNQVVQFRKRYLKQYKVRHNSVRKLISVDEMAGLINSILNPRDKAIVALLAKTGIRRGELINIDVDDVNWIDQSVRLKPHPKRSNCIVFFDDECSRVLRRWMKTRETFNLKPESRALFVSSDGNRLMRHGVYTAVIKHAERIGLHNPDSKKLEDRFTPHCCRHWFTTHLRRNGMRRALIKELRGDSRNEAVDIYDHIDRKELKRAYLAAIPLLGIG